MILKHKLTLSFVAVFLILLGSILFVLRSRPTPQVNLVEVPGGSLCTLQKATTVKLSHLVYVTDSRGKTVGISGLKITPCVKQVGEVDPKLFDQSFEVVKEFIYQRTESGSVTSVSGVKDTAQQTLQGFFDSMDQYRGQLTFAVDTKEE